MFTSSGLDAVVSERSAYARTRGSRPEAPASSAVASSSGAGAHASRAASSPAFARALRSVASSGAASGSACSQMENLQRDTHMMHVNLAAALAPTAPGLPVHRPLRARRAPSPAAVPPPTAPASSTGRDCTIHDNQDLSRSGRVPPAEAGQQTPVLRTASGTARGATVGDAQSRSLFLEKCKPAQLQGGLGGVLQNQ